MRNVLFVAPFWMEATVRFADAIGKLDGVRLFGICQTKEGGQAPADVARFVDYREVADCLNADQIEAAAREMMKKHGAFLRITGILEHAQQPIAEVRERLGLPGLPLKSAALFTDKNVMKEKLRAMGLPVAKHALVGEARTAHSFAGDVGFPLVVKPPLGAGSRSTYMVNTPQELQEALQAAGLAQSRAVQIEEFITGDEYSYDTVTIDNKVVFDSVTRYSTPPLDAVRNDWIQFTYFLPRNIVGPEFDEARRIGIEAVNGLGMASGITHMEWFRRRDGSVVIGEIAARPPGAHITRCMGLIHDTDFYRVWARATVDNAFDGPWKRTKAAGTVFFRGVGKGNIVAVDNIDDVNKRVSKYVVEAKLPEVGTPKNDHYEGDGYAIVMASETETVTEVLKDIISNVRVRYA